jgi:hypothetical protein
MKLLRLETHGIRSLPDREVEVGDARGATSPVVVVTGPPSAGITTWLEALVGSLARVARLGFAPEPDDLLRSGASTGRVRSVWALDEDEQRFAGLDLEPTDAEVVFQRGGIGHVDADPGFMGLLDRYDHRPETSKIVFIPARRTTEASFAPSSDLEGEMRQYRLAFGEAKLGHLPRFTSQLAERSPERFARLSQLFQALSGTARLERGVTIEAATAEGLRLPLRKLSTTEQSAFVLAAMVVLLGLDRSVIVVDAFDLGLATGTAARWLDVLREATPAAQWIVGARDPALVERGGAAVVSLPQRRST